MLDEIRQRVEDALKDVLAEIDRLRGALTALGSGRASTPAQQPKAQRARARRATQSHPGPRRATPSPTTSARAPSGATRAAILAALASGEAMTATQIATATGLRAGTVSTTLSRLAKSGEITKAARGYQLATQQQVESAPEQRVATASESPKSVPSSL